MKTLTVLFIPLALFFHQATAQPQAQPTQLVSKKGYPILPETGDWSLGFDAVPLVNFALNAVNIMNNTGQAAQNPGYMSGFQQVIVGKYFATSRTAYRAKLGIGLQADNTSFFFDDPLDASADPDELEDVFKERSTDVFVSAGIELRRGDGRVQGFFGAEGLLGVASSKTVNEYGLEWNQDAEDAGLVAEGQRRLLRDVNATVLGVGGRGFVGVEYFFAPKMSISAEYGIGLVFSAQGRGKQVFEEYENGSTSEVEESGLTRERGIEMAVDDANASLNLLIYF